MDHYTAVEERHATVLMDAFILNISMYICLKAKLLEPENKHELRHSQIIEFIYL